jgi:hypothetical protein
MPYKDRERQFAYGKAHYRANKQRYFDRNRINRAKLRQYVAKIKESTPCTDCGKQYPHYVMDFDHLGDKLGLINDFIKRHNKAALDLEIAKCEVVCSNCHRIRSFNRLAERTNIRRYGRKFTELLA